MTRIKKNRRIRIGIFDPKTDPVCKIHPEKAQYKTKNDARVAIAKIKKMGKELHVYKCPDCKWFHLTKSERSNTADDLIEGGEVV